MHPFGPRFQLPAINEISCQDSSPAHVVQLAVAPVLLLAGVALLVGHEMKIDVCDKVRILLIAAMLAPIGALGCFLREIALATGAIKGLSRQARKHDARRRLPAQPAD